MAHLLDKDAPALWLNTPSMRSPRKILKRAAPSRSISPRQQVQTIIQLIETQWTKKSRGAPAARLRNAIPEFLPIPDSSLANQVLFHHVVYSEHNDFLPGVHSKVSCFSESDSTTWRVCVCPSERGSEIQFFGTPFTQTSGRATDTVLLEVNTWLRIVANRRISEEYGWAYRKFVYNIICGRISEANSILASAGPISRLNYETQLW